MNRSMKEYRVLIERPGLHGPSVYYRTGIRELARLQMQQDVAHYRAREPKTCVWIESRTVGDWEVEA